MFVFCLIFYLFFLIVLILLCFVVSGQLAFFGIGTNVLTSDVLFFVTCGFSSLISLVRFIFSVSDDCVCDTIIFLCARGCGCCRIFKNTTT
ncbi:uncharacterized protein LOC105198544 [Solenopsis invicta]|uniref:uncharacterized protein LOC105198544 n=1 Tax=Solenopsis invicta TaxID=13686 RepID=UPI00193DBA59|nr:uncharacterized protein LOC105198544 [Solenopsis invicta]